jgi:hypothetical protein
VTVGMSVWRSLFVIVMSCSAVSAQDIGHELSLGVGGLFPVSGYKATAYATGPALRVAYELRFKRHIGAELGWTGAWPNQDAARHQLQLVDYGLRGILPIAADRAELSAGVGGGYIWYDRGYSNSYLNGSLLQYSGRVAAPLNSRRRLWIGSRSACGGT